MTKIPLQLRLAGIGGALGGGIGSLVAAFFGPGLFNLAIGFLLGFGVGFALGYRLGGMVKETERIARAEQVASGFNKTIEILAWLFVAIGVTALIKDGWDPSMVLVTLFFLACSLYLAHRRLRGSK